MRIKNPEDTTAALGTQEFVTSLALPLAIRCGPTQHDYQQGMDSMEHPEGQFGHLLYCRNCGDVITFALPREGE